MVIAICRTGHYFYNISYNFTFLNVIVVWSISKHILHHNINFFIAVFPVKILNVGCCDISINTDTNAIKRQGYNLFGFCFKEIGLVLYRHIRYAPLKNGWRRERYKPNINSQRWFPIIGGFDNIRWTCINITWY